MFDLWKCFCVREIIQLVRIKVSLRLNEKRNSILVDIYSICIVLDSVIVSLQYVFLMLYMECKNKKVKNWQIWFSQIKRIPYILSIGMLSAIDLLDHLYVKWDGYDMMYSISCSTSGFRWWLISQWLQEKEIRRYNA